MLAEQLITRIEYIHKKNYLHKDIKPDNILIGYGQSKSTIYLADFGLSKNYNQFTSKQKNRRVTIANFVKVTYFDCSVHENIISNWPALTLV